jgi:predicted membrane-bound spermidine synthase
VRGLPRTALYIVFAITGFSALTLQVVWQRVIALHSGVDLVSFTTVVAAFLAGLGIGNLLGGWLADRLRSRASLLAFAVSNLVIGAFALVSIWLLYDVYQAQADQLASTATKFAFNFALVLVPTTLMGLSLPLVARGVVGRIDEAGPLVGRLYAVNTLGAAAGAALAGWVLLGTFGFVTTARLAGTLNLIAAGLVFVVWRVARAGAATPAEAEAPATTVDESSAPAAGAHIWPWFVVYGVTGAVALGFELVFFRVIDAVMRSNSYSFPHVLASYLLFFGAGSALGSVVVKRTRRPDRWFLVLQFLVGVAALVGLIVLVRVTPNSPIAERAASFFSGDGFDFGFRNADGTPNRAFIPVFFGVPLLIMGAPVLLMGASFPCAQALVSQRIDSLGRHTGTLLFSNIVGNVVGTLLVGFVALDTIGTTGTYLVLALLLLAPGVAWTWLSHGRRRWVALGGVVAVFALLVAVTPSNTRFWSYINGVSEPQLSLAEDRSCATALKYVDGQEVLTINASSQNNYPFDDFHVLIGLTPSVIHPEPQHAMAVGLGIGATPYGLLVDPRLESLTTVELCGGEIELLEGLAAEGAPELQRFFADPRQTVVVGDGRDHLLRSDAQYDVVVVDVVRPQAAFSGSLYSVEFYELIRDHLAPGGLMAQWTPTPRVVNTITEVFPYVSRFVVPTYRDSPFVIASNEPIPFDREVLLEHLEAERDAFSPEQYASLREFLEAVQPQCLRAGGEPVPLPDEGLNRDLFPRDEYFLNNSDAAERPPACG